MYRSRGNSVTGSPSTTANGISPCAGAVSGVTGGGTCGTRRKVGFVGSFACSVKLCEPRNREVEVEEESPEGIQERPKQRLAARQDHQQDDDHKAKGLDAFQEVRAATGQ